MRSKSFVAFNVRPLLFWSTSLSSRGSLALLKSEAYSAKCTVLKLIHSVPSLFCNSIHIASCKFVLLAFSMISFCYIGHWYAEVHIANLIVGWVENTRMKVIEQPFANDFHWFVSESRYWRLKCIVCARCSTKIVLKPSSMCRKLLCSR